MPEQWKLLRAAWGYSGLGQDELANELGVPPATFRGYLRRGGDANNPPDDLALKVARLCRVPPQFMTTGFAPMEEPIDEVAEGLYLLREEYGKRLAQLEQGLAILGASITPRASDAPPPGPPGELGRRAIGSPHTDEDREQPPNPAAGESS